MGQTPSQPEIQRQTKPSNTMISQQQEKLRFMEDLDQSVLTEPEDSSGCCNMFQSGSNQLKSGEPWKKRMIDEMTNLTLDNWPQQLINFLKKQKTMETDKIFQSDVLWFDNNYANRPLDQAITRLKFIEIGKLSFIEQTPKNNTRSMSASIDEKMEKDVNASQLENDKIEQENVLGTLLDASEIFDEKVHKLSGKASWIDRSFDIKKPEYTQPIPSYLDQVPPYNILETHVRHASFLRSGSVDDANTPRRLGETYNNNTILHQVPKIPNDSDGLYQSILKYKTVTNIVEKHLNQPTNIFRQLINQFEAYYVGYYQKFAQSLGKKKKISADEIDSYSVKATLDLQQFIRILYEGLNLYYRLKLLKVGKLPDNETLFNRDNILNFLTSIIFTEKIYNIIFDLYRFQDKTIEEKFQKNVRLCQNLRPQDFTIPPLFCLNEKTIDHFKEKGFFPPSIVEESIMSKSYDEKRKLPNGDESPQRSASVVSGSSKEEIIFYISPVNKAQLRLQPPYQKAIEALPVIKTCRSPVHKVKTILKVIELISQSIEEFYKQNGVTNTKKLDGDHTLAICMYVVAKSGLENIKTHCKLIERFSTANILNSISGYYATTLEACVDCLCSMDLHQTGNKNDVSMSLKQRIQSFDLGSPV